MIKKMHAAIARGVTLMYNVKKERCMKDFISQNIIWLAIAAAALVTIIVMIIVACAKKAKRKKIDRSVMNAAPPAHPAPPEHHRYDEKGGAYVKGDYIVSKGRTIVAGSDVAAGKYTVLSAMENVSAFNVRINGFVREVEHNTVVILGDGDTFCPVSHSVILR